MTTTMDGLCVSFCGLAMFHVNAVLVTGLLPFSRGAHVILGTPQGPEAGHDALAAVVFFSGVPTLYASALGRSFSRLATPLSLC